MKVNEFHKQICYLCRGKRKISAQNEMNKLINTYETQKKVEGIDSPQSFLQKCENTLENSLMYALFRHFLGNCLSCFLGCYLRRPVEPLQNGPCFVFHL